MIRLHDVEVVREREDGTAIAEGTFRVLLTKGRRLAAEIELGHSELGPLRLLFEIDYGGGRAVPTSYRTAGIFDDVGHAFSHVAHDVEHRVEHVAHVAHDVGHMAEHAAEGAFNAVSKVATTLARPVFDITRDAAAGGASLLAHLPFVPEAERKRIASASRIIMKARLGDITAKDFIRDVALAAKAGVHGFREAGDALLTGTRVVAHVLDAPLALAGRIPGIGATIHSFSPFQKLEHMADAIQHGDFARIERMVTDDVRMAAGVASLVPGIGTGISSALDTGLAILDGDGPIEIAISAAYGAIPIPPGLRTITDAVLASVMSIAKRGSVTDAALAGARDAVPPGLPRDVFDTLVRLIVKRVPVTRVAEDLVGHYVKRYAPDVPLVHDAVDAVDHVAHAVRASAAPVTRLVDAASHLASPVAHIQVVPPQFRLAAGAHL